MDGPAHAEAAVEARPPLRRLHRDVRRKQIIQAAKRAFAQTGFAHTSLDDVAQAADVSRALIYRHFDSKSELYIAALDDFGDFMQAELGPRESWAPDSVEKLVEVAIVDPDGFLLLFEHAAREPEFTDVVNDVRERSVDIAREQMPQKLGSTTYVDWAARFVPVALTQAVVTWIEAGQPQPERAAQTIGELYAAITKVFGGKSR